MGKKTSAIKPSDKDKAWNRHKTASRYKTSSRPVLKSILIVCEGQTEKIYFESFPVLSVMTECVDAKGRSKLALVDEVSKIIKRKKGAGIEFDEVWCVFDMDFKHGQKECSDFDNAISSAQDKKYKVAYSNDAFEIWYYLHYHYTDQGNHRRFYYQKLSGKWGFNYVKNGKKEDVCYETYNRLSCDKDACQKRAISNAKKLHEKYSDNRYHSHNPVTTVYLLVEELNQYLAR